MLLRRHLLFLLLMLTAAQAWAQMSVALSTAQGHPGDVVELSLSLQGTDEVTALEATIDLPEQLHYVEGSAVLSPERANADHRLSISQTGRRLAVYVYSLTLLPLQGTQGELLRFRLSLGREPGSYALLPAVVLSNSQGGSVACSVTAGSVTLLSPQIALTEQQVDFGRVPIRSSYTRTFIVRNTGNEPLTISSVECSSPVLTVSPATATIAAAREQAFTLTYAPQQGGAEQATVTIRSDAAHGPQTLAVIAEPYSVNELCVTGGEVGSGDELTVSVALSNMEPIVAAQCSFLVPEQLAYVEGSALLSDARADGHQLAVGSDSQRVTFYVFSDGNTPLRGNDGELFTFRLRPVGTGGSYALVAEDVILSNSEGADMTSGKQDAEVSIAAPRAECADRLSFGRVPMEQPAQATLTLHNSGQQPLSVERVVFTDEAFTLLTDPLPVVSPGESGTLTVAWQPAGEGPGEGSMLLYTNDPDRRLISVSMQGEAFATVELTLEGSAVENHPEQFAIQVGLRNSLPVVAMQFDLHWVPQMSLTDDALLLTGRHADHQATLSKVSDGHYRVFLWSLSNATLATGEGGILMLTYSPTTDGVSFLGTTLTADNIILSTADEQNSSSKDCVQLQIGMKGDANNDGRVTIADVAAMVTHLLGHTPADFNLALADVDADGTVTMADVTAVADIIIEK